MENPVEEIPELHELESARLLSGLGRFEMWVRYFSLGGQASPLELDAFFNDSLHFSDPEYNIIVQALNERLEEIGVPSMLDFRFVAEPENVYDTAHEQSQGVLERSTRTRSEAIEMRISAVEMRDAAHRVHQKTLTLFGILEQQRIRLVTQAASLGIELH